MLLLLGQSPFDPTSGAAQSTRLVVETLVRQGFEAWALSTTGCEGDLPGDHTAVLAELGIPAAEDAGGVLRYEAHGVVHNQIPTAPAWKHDWERRVGARYAAEYQRLLDEWRPDVVLTYGGDPMDVARRRLARRAGATVVFALHNLYYRAHPPAEVDVFLAPTRFLAEAYAGKLSAPVDVLPPPLDPTRILAEAPEQTAVVFINPEPAKGSLLVAQLADRLGRERRAITLLVVGGRVPAEGLAVAGRDLGLDLTRHENLLQVPPTGRVSEIWAAARVVLLPSVVPEAAGRCALEAMLNGSVPLVSDQGGLAEIVGDAGIRLPPPPDLAGRARPVPPQIVEAWWRALIRLFDDEVEWKRRSVAARALAAANTLEAVGPAYAAWFRQAIRKT